MHRTFSRAGRGTGFVAVPNMKNKSFVICLAVLITTFLSITALALREVPVVVATNLEKLPVFIGEYKGTEDSFPDSVYRELNADRHVYRHYRAPDGRQVDLYIGYYGTAKGGRTGHNPNACLPGVGWGILESKRIKLYPKHHEDGVEVNYILSRRGEINNTVLHWYQSSGDKVLSTGIQMNVWRFFSKLLHNRADGAFVQISTFSGGDSSIKKAGLVARSFAQEVLELLPQYWPVEK
jgi:EpsI family protein